MTISSDHDGVSRHTPTPAVLPALAERMQGLADRLGSDVAAVWERVIEAGLARLEHQADAGMANLATRPAADAALQEANEQTNRSLAQLEAVIQNISEGVVILTPSGRIASYNKAVLAIYGLPADTTAEEDVQAYALRFLLSDLDGNRLPREQWPMFRALQGDTFSGHEVHGRHLDTGKEWIGSYSARPVLDGSGRMVLAVVTFHDVTAERQAQRALQESEARFRLLAENMPQIVWTAEGTGAVDYLNPRWYQYSGMTPEASLGAGWRAVLHPDDRPGCQAAWEQAVSQALPYSVEVRYRQADGAYRWHLASAVPIVDNRGRIQCWLGAAADIEDQKQAIVLRDNFLSIASHELRTPLTSLSLQIDSISRRLARSGEAVPDWMRHKLASGHKQVARLEALIEEMLDVSRINAERLQLDLAAVDLAAVVDDAVAGLAGQAENDAAAVHCRLQRPVVGRWDASRLEQIVTNLLGNALKYGHGHPVTVTLTADGAQALLQVRDQGPGIPPEHQERIFERFERLASVRHYGGFGLGLWIVRQLIDALGGTIGLESAPGRGATFTVTLPLAGPQPADGMAAGEAGPPATES